MKKYIEIQKGKQAGIPLALQQAEYEIAKTFRTVGHSTFIILCCNFLPVSRQRLHEDLPSHSNQYGPQSTKVRHAESSLATCRIEGSM